MLLNDLKIFINSRVKLYNSSFNKRKDLYNFIFSETRFLDHLNISILERVWYIINSINSVVLCENCMKEKALFINLKLGYRKYCSLKCAMNSETTKNKVKKTNLEKYGKDNPWKCEKIKDKIKKTNLEKYGEDNPWKCEKIRQKIKQTNLIRYGFIHPTQCKEIKDKVKKTFLEKYGVTVPYKNNIIKEKGKATERFRHFDKFKLNLKLKNIKPLFSKYEYTKKLNINLYKCIKCRTYF